MNLAEESRILGELKNQLPQVPWLEDVRYDVQQEVLGRFADASQALACLKEQQPREGWITWQSANTLFFDGIGESPNDAGLLLHGEATTHTDQSLSVRYLGSRDGWLVVCTRFEAADEGAFLRDEVDHLRAGADDRDPNSRIRYLRFWKHSDQLGYAPRIAMFAGFTEGSRV